VVLSGAVDLTADDQDHEVGVALKMYIPYIVTAHGVLMIDESLERQMTGVTR